MRSLKLMTIAAGIALAATQLCAQLTICSPRVSRSDSSNIGNGHLGSYTTGALSLDTATTPTGVPGVYFLQSATASVSVLQGVRFLGTSREGTFIRAQATTTATTWAESVSARIGGLTVLTPAIIAPGLSVGTVPLSLSMTLPTVHRQYWIGGCWIQLSGNVMVGGNASVTADRRTHTASYPGLRRERLHGFMRTWTVGSSTIVASPLSGGSASVAAILGFPEQRIDFDEQVEPCFPGNSVFSRTPARLRLQVTAGVQPFALATSTLSDAIDAGAYSNW